MDSEKSEAHFFSCEYSNRVPLKSIFSREDHGLGLEGHRIVIGGWVRSSGEIKKEINPGVECDKDNDQEGIPCLEILFRLMNPFRRRKIHAQDKLGEPNTSSTSILRVSDGSCVTSLRVVVEPSVPHPSQTMLVGASILAEGILCKSSIEGKPVVELKVYNFLHIGAVDAERYPFSKKPVVLSALRDVPHFRPRTKLVSSVMRVRSVMTFAVHTFLQEQNFLCIQSPTLTTTAAEFSVEKIYVTTPRNKGVVDTKCTKQVNEDLKIAKQAIKEKERCIEELKMGENIGETLDGAMQDLAKAHELKAQLKNEIQPKRVDVGNLPSQTHLTASSRLHLESYACSLGNVYSFGPVFRDYNQLSSIKVLEMWVLELEIAFSQVEDAMRCGCDLLKFICKRILENCHEEIQLLSRRNQCMIIDRLQLVTTSECQMVQYCEAINCLEQVTDKKFECKVKNGVALTEEHVKYLSEKYYKKPIVIYNFPKELRPFHVQVNDDGRTVAAFDIIIPKVGTLIKCMQNEGRLNVIEERIKEFKLPRSEYDWYLDLRRHGMVKTSGLCLAFDLLVLYATGMDDVRDVIPFPSSHGLINH